MKVSRSASAVNRQSIPSDKKIVDKLITSCDPIHVGRSFKFQVQPKMSFTSRLSQIASRRFSTKKFNDVVIVAATRTPIGSFQAGFNGLSATQLGGIAVEAAVQQAGIAKENVDEVILGNVVSAGLGKRRRRS
jgi:hypothetical protein